MKVKKSRVYTQDDGSKVSFTFDRDDGRIIGISKNGKSVSPTGRTDFNTLSQSTDALAAYNVAKYADMTTSASIVPSVNCSPNVQPFGAQIPMIEASAIAPP